MLSTYLQAFFKKSHVPMAEIARQSGVSIPTISRMRSGEISNPQWLTVVALFGAIGGSLDAAAEITAADLPQQFVLENKVSMLKQQLEDARIQLDKERTYRAEDRASDRRENRFVRRVCLYLIIALVFMCYLFVDARNADWGIFQDSTVTTVNGSMIFWVIVAITAASALVSAILHRK